MCPVWVSKGGPVDTHSHTHTEREERERVQIHTDTQTEIPSPPLLSCVLTGGLDGGGWPCRLAPDMVWLLDKCIRVGTVEYGLPFLQSLVLECNVPAGVPDPPLVVMDTGEIVQ